MTDHRCSRTGLALVAPPTTPVWRIAKTSYGPLNPPRRSAGPNDREDWGRYDVPECRTVYAGEPQQAAYAESIAFARLRLGEEPAHLLRDLFDDVETGDSGTLVEVVEREWTERHHMSPGLLAQGWRDERRLHRLTLPHAGWFVEVEASSSVAVLAGAIGPQLAERGLSVLTVGTLRGEDRRITTTIAEWLAGVDLFDGSHPLGVAFGSKHGSDWRCWAVWLHGVDAGTRDPRRLLRADEGCAIDDPEHNPALQEVAALFGIRVL